LVPIKRRSKNEKAAYPSLEVFLEYLDLVIKIDITLRDLSLFFAQLEKMKTSFGLFPV
jgi:hypothetical protein